MDSYRHIDPKEEIINTRLHMLEAASTFGGKALACLGGFIFIVAVAVICILFCLAAKPLVGRAETAPSSACR